MGEVTFQYKICLLSTVPVFLWQVDLKPQSHVSHLKNLKQDVSCLTCVNLGQSHLLQHTHWIADGSQTYEKYMGSKGQPVCSTSKPVQEQRLFAEMK